MQTTARRVTLAPLVLVLIAVAASSLLIPAPVAAQTKPVEIRLSYIAPPPNDMMPLFFQHDFFKQNLLKEHGKKYTVSFLRVAGSPGAATAMAAGELDIATLSFPVAAHETRPALLRMCPSAMPFFAVSATYRNGDGSASKSLSTLVLSVPLRLKV